jgi:hypothetical protein
LDHPLLRELFGQIEDSGTPEAARLWTRCQAWFEVRDAALREPADWTTRIAQAAVDASRDMRARLDAGQPGAAAGGGSGGGGMSSEAGQLKTLDVSLTRTPSPSEGVREALAESCWCELMDIEGSGRFALASILDRSERRIRARHSPQCMG